MYACTHKLNDQLCGLIQIRLDRSRKVEIIVSKCMLTKVRNHNHGDYWTLRFLQCRSVTVGNCVVSVVISLMSMVISLLSVVISLAQCDGASNKLIKLDFSKLVHS